MITLRLNQRIRNKGKLFCDSITVTLVKCISHQHPVNRIRGNNNLQIYNNHINTGRTYKRNELLRYVLP